MSMSGLVEPGPVRSLPVLAPGIQMSAIAIPKISACRFGMSSIHHVVPPLCLLLAEGPVKLEAKTFMNNVDEDGP